MNMKGYVYVLQTSDSKYYVGSTIDIENRVFEHTIGEVKSTRCKRPIKVLVQKEYNTINEARRMELVLKKLKSRKYIERFIEGSL